MCPRLDCAFLENQFAVAEARLRLCLGDFKRLGKLIRLIYAANAAAASSRHRLEQDRVADSLRFSQCVQIARDGPVGPGHHRTSGGNRRFLRLGLVPHRLDRFHRRADELHPQRFQGFRKPGPLAKVAVTRVNRLRARDLRRHQHVPKVQIAVRVAARANANRMVGDLHVQAIFVRLRVDRNALHTQFAAAPDDTAGNFAPIRHQNLLKHQNFSWPGCGQ